MGVLNMKKGSLSKGNMKWQPQFMRYPWGYPEMGVAENKGIS
jgi:hypothetical protein